MEFYEAVRRRRSIRRFKPDPVPEETLERMLEAFRLAPSWANVQPWEVVLVTDPGVKKLLQGTLPKVNPALYAVAAAPVVACVVGIEGLSGFYKGRPATKRGDWLLFDLGIACEHLALAAAAEGLGTVHVALFDYEKAGEILSLPAGRTCVELIPLGSPDSEPNPVPRKPLGDIVHRERYAPK